MILAHHVVVFLLLLLSGWARTFGWFRAVSWSTTIELVGREVEASKKIEHVGQMVNVEVIFVDNLKDQFICIGYNTPGVDSEPTGFDSKAREIILLGCSTKISHVLYNTCIFIAHRKLINDKFCR